jgi:hypothetical protein
VAEFENEESKKENSGDKSKKQHFTVKKVKKSKKQEGKRVNYKIKLSRLPYLKSN